MTYFDYSKNGGRSEVKNAADILFYQTGSANVSGLNTNTYVPGALADHLTSNGGNLFGTEQMSALRWLEAGVTASYGTVTEPCAYADKFPAASVLVKSYFRGNTALEAYTKSVRQPSQGVFVGDPLARPFGTRATLVNGVLNIKTSSLEPGINYNLYSAPSATGPFSQIATVAVPRYQFATITVPGKSAPFYKLEMSGSFPTPIERSCKTAESNSLVCSRTYNSSLNFGLCRSLRRHRFIIPQFERVTRFALRAVISFTASALYYAGPAEQPRAPLLSWNKKISTVKGIQYIICCRFEIIAVDMNTMLEKPAARA